MGIIEMSYNDVVAEVQPHLDKAGYTLEEWLEGCENDTIRDGKLRNLWIGYGAALT